jgi:hypothetical protein
MITELDLRITGFLTVLCDLQYSGHDSFGFAIGKGLE